MGEKEVYGIPKSWLLQCCRDKWVKRRSVCAVQMELFPILAILGKVPVCVHLSCESFMIGNVKKWRRMCE